MSAKRAKAAGYLCMSCAEQEGGVWPNGHRATFHGGICPLCNKKSSLACWDDWSWPKSKLNGEANRTREI